MAGMNLKDAMGHILNKSRDNVGNHFSLCKKLRGVYDSTKKKKLFTENFYNMLKKILIHGQRDTEVNNSLDFIVRFVLGFETVRDVDAGEEGGCWHPFIEDVFNFLLENHDVTSQAVRFRVCQLINRILDGMGEKAVITDDIHEKICDAMFRRLLDRSPVVRVQAVVAIERLQNPESKNCKVMKALLYHLERDPNPDVRRRVLTVIAPTSISLGAVLGRLQDVNRQVRHQALIYLAERIHIRSLKISHRLMVLRAVHSPRLEFDPDVVRDKLLHMWLETADHSVLDLLKMFDVEDSFELVIKMLHLVFSSCSPKDVIKQLSMLTEEKTIAADRLTPEIVVYWRAAVEYLHSKNLHDDLDALLPEMVNFDTMLIELDSLIQGADDSIVLFDLEFVFQQLLSFAPYFDTADEVGRSHLCKALLLMLQDNRTSSVLLRPIVKAYSVLEMKCETRIARLFEVISELREPLTASQTVRNGVNEEHERKQRAAQIRIKLHEARDRLEDTASGDNLDRITALKLEVRELEIELARCTAAAAVLDDEQGREERNDPDTLVRCLSIICELLQSPQIRKLGPELLEGISVVILPCVQQEDPAVRCVALEALACCCLIDKLQAQKHLILFFQALSLDNGDVKVVAANALFDLLLVFGLQTLEEGDRLVNLLSQQLVHCKTEEDPDSAEQQLIDRSVEGFCKLFLARRVESSEILAKLVVALFNPATEKKLQLRQMLNVFFMSFASKSCETQAQIADAFVPAMKLIRKAPITSPVAEVSVSSVVKFFADMTKPQLLLKAAEPFEGHGLQNRLACVLLQQARKSPDSVEGRCCLKGLSMLAITLNDAAEAREMQTDTRKLLRSFTDKPTLKILEKFSCLLEAFLSSQTDLSDSPGVSTANQDSSRQRGRQQRLMSKTATMMLDAVDEENDVGDPEDSPPTPKSPPSKVKTAARKKIGLSSARKSKTTKTPQRSRVVVEESSPSVSSDEGSLVVIQDSDEEFQVETNPPQRILRSAMKKKKFQ